jgi:hypothetical protein
VNTETLQTLFVEQALNDTLAVLVDRADEANKQFRIACIDVVSYSGYGPCWEIVNDRLGPLCNFWLDGAEPPDCKPQPITAESLKAQFEDVLQTAKLVREPPHAGVHRMACAKIEMPIQCKAVQNDPPPRSKHPVHQALDRLCARGICY